MARLDGFGSVAVLRIRAVDPMQLGAGPRGCRLTVSAPATISNGRRGAKE